MAQLNAVQVRAAKAGPKPYKLADGHGLNLHISPTGKKTWRYRYRIVGKETVIVLGEYPQMTLEAARAARVKAREMVKQGINPAHERKAKKTAAIAMYAPENSFEFIANEWMDKQRDQWSAGHSMAVFKSLKINVFPGIGKLPIDSITPPMVMKTLEAVEQRGALEIARKTLQRVNAVFMYAVRTGRATYNPAASLQGALKTRKVQHVAALAKDELPTFLQRLETAHIHIITKLSLKFVMLTAARTGEVRGATWAEIDLNDRLWRIPAVRMKMNAPHNVPLSRQAVKILELAGDIYGRNGYVFPAIRNSEKQMSQNTMLFALHSMGYRDRITVHGFRSTFSTICNEHGFDGDVIEKTLAHTERNRVRAAYHRSEYLEQRRELMQWWADLLQEMVQQN